MRFERSLVPAAVCSLLSLTAAHAQRGTGDWMTSGFDAQRSHWVRADNKISVASLSKPGFELDWKVRLNTAPRGMNTSTPPALLDFYIGYRGFRALGFFGAASDRVIAYDIDLAKVEWEKSFSAGAGPAPTAPCPGGMTSAVARPTNIAYPNVVTGSGAGRGTPARSGVGEPHEGAVTLKRVAPPSPPPPPPAAAAKPAAPAVNPFAPRVQWVAAVSADGKFHQMWVSNGNEPNPAIPFLPANANAQGLIVFEDTAYVATANGCGGAADGVWALDLSSKKVSQWKASKAVAGTVGPAVRPDGTLFAAAGNELAALAPKSLTPTGAYRAGGIEFTSSPVIFEHNGHNLLAVASSDGRLQLFDSASLQTGPLDRTEPFSAAGYATGALASWRDAAGTRWVLAPGSGKIAAFKVEDRNGKPSFVPGWMSRDLTAPVTPVIINGVVFALSAGDKASPAVLYALEGISGKELWSSGRAMASFVTTGRLAAGGSRVYVATYDGTQYAFGFPIEH